MRKISVIAVSLLGGTLVLAGCGSSGSSAKSSAPAGGSSSSSSAAASSPAGAGGGSLTLGSADFPENELLMYIYGGALKAKGVSVSYHPNIGERATYIAALKQGSINFVPEYTGSILTYFDPKTTAKTPAAVYSALQAAAAKQGLDALKYAPAQDSDTITVTQQTASKYHLSAIGDLKPVASHLTFGAPAQFKTRADGIPALKSVYGVVFGRFTALSAGGTITVNALKNGTVDAADIFSTDPSIVQNHFVSLKDPKSMFAAQNIVPLIAKNKVTPTVTAACDAVSAKLSTKTLGSLVAKVAGGSSAQTVAASWLKSAGLG